MNHLEKLLIYLSRLEESKIFYTLAHHRSDAIMVKIDVPGERWEAEFFADGLVEVERFKSVGDVTGEETLDILFP